MYHRQLVLNRYCLPSGSAIRKSFFSNAGMEKVGQYLSDLYTAWKVLAIAVGLAFFFALFYMLILRCCAKTLVWITFLGFLALLGVIGYFFYNKAVNTDDDGDKLNYQILAIVFWSIDFLVFLMICCVYDDIQLALTIIQASGAFVFQTCSVLFVPIFVIILAAGYMVYWIVTVIYIYSIGKITQYGGTPFASVDWEDSTRNLWYYHLFALFWILAFLISVLQLIIAATAAQWYFSSNSDQPGSGSVCRSLYWCIRYHVGSLAFGSLILAIVMFVRFIFEYMKVPSAFHNATCRKRSRPAGPQIG